jgi:hypothetical protein
MLFVSVLLPAAGDHLHTGGVVVETVGIIETGEIGISISRISEFQQPPCVNQGWSGRAQKVSLPTRMAERPKAFLAS